MGDREIVAILGGTGEQGLGLALRLARAGWTVRIGSRSLERARSAAASVRERVPNAAVQGLENAEAAAGATIVVFSVPFEHLAATVRAVRDRLRPGTVAVSMAVPLATAIGDLPSRVIGVPQGSCAELCRELLPPEIEVVGAFQNVSAHRLLDLERPVDCDVILSGPPAARARVAALCEAVPGLRAVHGGPLYTARYVEPLTALLIGLNRRYGVREGLGIRLTYLPETTAPGRGDAPS